MLGLVSTSSVCSESLVSVELVVAVESGNVKFVASDRASSVRSVPGEVDEARSVSVNSKVHGSGGLANIDRCKCPSRDSTGVGSLDSEVVSGGVSADGKLVSQSVLTDALSIADVVVALTEIGLNLVSFSSSVKRVVPVEGDRVAILDGVESVDRGRSGGKSNSRLVVILCRVGSSASIVKGSNLNLEVVAGLNVVLGEVLLSQSARVSVVQARLVEDSRTVSHRSDVALRKSNPVVLSLVLELVVRDSSHLDFILTDGRAS